MRKAQNWAQSQFPELPASLTFIREQHHLCLARILVASRRCEEALDLLQRLSFEAQAGNRLGRLLKINILRALALDGLGRPEEALDLLEDCLRFAHPEGYRRVFLDEGAPMKAMLRRGVQERAWHDRVIMDYTGKLLEAFEL